MSKNRFNILTEKQKQLVVALLDGCDFDLAAERLGIHKRSVYRRAANIRNRIAKNRHLDVAARGKIHE